MTQTLIDPTQISPGTTGQVLTTESGTVEWATPTSGSPARVSESATSVTLAYGASDTTQTLACKKSSILQYASTNVPALVRFYSTAAAQTADAGRPIGGRLPNPQNAGVCAELMTTASNLGPLTGPFILQNLDATPNEYVYLTIFNLSLSPASVTVTCEVLPLET